MKRKSDESAFEFRKRKKADKLRKEHMYDYEKDYWKNESKQATRENKYRISNLMATVGGGAVAPGAVNTFNTISKFAPGIEGMFVGAAEAEGLATAITLGGAIGSGGAVAAAAGLGYLVGNMMDVDVAQNKLLSLMPGTYQGKFALSKNASTKGLRDKYQKTGGVYIVENYGTLVDPDLCFIGQSTYNTECIRRAVGYAMLRKLFRKGCGIDITSPYEELPIKDLVPSSGPNAYKISYTTRSSNGVISNFTHDIAND